MRYRFFLSDTEKYQIAHSAFGFLILCFLTFKDGFEFFARWEYFLPYELLAEWPAATFFGFVILASAGVFFNVQVMPKYFVSFDAAFILTLLFTTTPEVATWVAVLGVSGYIARALYEGEPLRQTIFQAFENAGNRALRYLAGGLIYRWAGGVVPLWHLSVVDTVYPAIMAMLTIIVVNNLFFLPREIIDRRPVKNFFRDLIVIDVPLTSLSLPLGIIGSAVFAHTSIGIYILLVVAYLSFCYLVWMFVQSQKILRKNVSNTVVLSDAMRRVSATLYPRALAHLIGETGQKIFDSDGFIVATTEPALGKISIVHAVKNGKEVDHIVYRESEEKIKYFIDKNEVVLINSRSDEPLREAAKRAFPSYGADEHSFIFAPLTTAHGTLGMLVAIGKVGETYTREDAQCLAFFAQHSAICYLNATLFERATVDELTQLYTRYYFIERAKEFAGAAMSGKKPPFAIALGDMDNLKNVNDSYGHSAGDKAIAAVAASIVQATMPEVMVARYGGDEFALLIPAATREKAMELTEKARSAVAEGVGTDKSAEAEYSDIKMTITFGVALYPPRGLIMGSSSADAMIEAMLHEADAALYSAKREGGNRSRVFHP